MVAAGGILLSLSLLALTGKFIGVLHSVLHLLTPKSVENTPLHERLGYVMSAAKHNGIR